MRLVSCFVQQPEEPSVPVIVDVTTAWDAMLHLQGIVGQSFGHGPQNISIDLRVGSNGRLFHHLHTVAEEQPRLSAPGGRVAMYLAATHKDCQVSRPAAQTVKRRMGLFPNGILKAEMLEFIVAVALDPVFVFA